MIYAPLADQDLLDIFLHIAQDDPIAAGRFIRQLTQKIEWIASSDFPGVPRDSLLPGLKALPFKRRCIYFRTTKNRVIILRVLHGHQNTTPYDFPESDT